MSIAGGLNEAILAGVREGIEAVQIFSRNANRWAMTPLTDATIGRWREALETHPMIPMVHGSYLVNLASPDEGLYRRSRETFLEEARRLVDLGIPYLVFHPGAHMGSGVETGLARIVKALDWVDRRLEGPVTLLLENTAGSGTGLGSRFEEIAWIRERVRTPERIQVCLDTCHLLAAGYDFRTEAGYRTVFADFENQVGTRTVRAFHLNDSKRELGSRVDRHENIGQGHLGQEPFRLLLRDRRFREVPKVIETPKAGNMDRKNLALLRRLARS
jgi:deoxyribonuclease-4